ncbi:RNA-binding E3 ubiquitin-protein ligase MEX3C [Tupaia chinensis]|uniref:RNA-binding E3 ubiquitin-protein ligase MEX3C n=1 Tax=Tupaia chinensis TaxID=246437 RepID=UPI000FFCC0DB|nr:RNA-binding E3 ubiquitin-protein ligase MEX3C [Tupaia chinensis]
MDNLKRRGLPNTADLLPTDIRSKPIRTEVREPSDAEETYQLPGTIKHEEGWRRVLEVNKDHYDRMQRQQWNTKGYSDGIERSPSSQLLEIMEIMVEIFIWDKVESTIDQDTREEDDEFGAKHFCLCHQQGTANFTFCSLCGPNGCKIKALRAKTNTYIKTPVRGEEPIFVVTGRKEDVAMAKREILSAAEHFSMIRASRNKNGPALGGLSCSPNLPGQTTVQVRVPYRVVGLVVGPKGATIKRIQQQTHTYIVTPSRDKEPVFEVTGMPENVDRAREEIEMHIAMRTGNYIELNEENDFHYNGTDVSFEGGTLGSAWLSNPVPPSRARMISNYRNDSSSSLGSGSTDSYFGSNRLADFSPTSPFSTGGNFWFGDTLPSVGSEDLAVDSPAFDSLPTSAQTIWTPFEPVTPLSGFGSDPSGNMKTQRRGSQPSTPRLSPTFPESMEHPLARRVRSDPPSTGNHVGLPIYIPAFSNGTNSYSSSNGGSTSSSPPESRRKHDCVICFENEVIAALVPCGHNLFCMECANKICEKRTPSCPVCQTAVTQAIQIHS